MSLITAGTAIELPTQVFTAVGGQPRRHPAPHKAAVRNELSPGGVTGAVGRCQGAGVMG